VLPGEAAGTLLSKTFTAVAGSALRLNGDVPDGSTLRVALLDADGMDGLPGYGFEDLCGPVGSGLDSSVRWKTRDTLPDDTPFRIRVEVTGQAELYALYL
jgi:hypothetical protein